MGFGLEILLGAFFVLFIQLHQVLVGAREIPDQRSSPGPLHWGCGVLATVPPGSPWSTICCLKGCSGAVLLQAGGFEGASSPSCAETDCPCGL